jgi:hypothetical protein
MVKRTGQAVVLIGTLASLAASASPGVAADCATIGCTSGATVELRKAARQVGEVASATVCVKDFCRSTRRTDGPFLVEVPKLVTDHARVRVVLYDRKHRKLMRVDQQVTLKSHGLVSETCPPPCWSRYLRLSTAHGGRLIPLD